MNTDALRGNLMFEDFDISQYPISNAIDNYMDFLYDEMVRERKLVKHCYYDQGYLGRILIYLIDKLILGCNTSFEFIKAERNKSS